MKIKIILMVIDENSLFKALKIETLQKFPYNSIIFVHLVH